MLKSQPFFLEKKYHCEERELAVIALNPPCAVQTVAGILFPQWDKSQQVKSLNGKMLKQTTAILWQEN